MRLRSIFSACASLPRVVLTRFAGENPRKKGEERGEGRGEHRVELLLSSVLQITSYLSLYLQLLFPWFLFRWRAVFHFSAFRFQFHQSSYLYTFERSWSRFTPLSSAITKRNEQNRNRETVTVGNSTRTSVIVHFHLETDYATGVSTLMVWR